MTENQRSKKILIVDDDQKFVMAVMTFLVGHGYQVLVAYDATFAIQYAAREDVSFVILDLGLPSGGGLFVIENLKRIPKTICLPLIVSSANVDPGMEEKARAMGANDFIRKPYDLELLLEKIKALLPA